MNTYLGFKMPIDTVEPCGCGLASIQLNEYNIAILHDENNILYTIANNNFANIIYTIFFAPTKK